MTDNTKWTADPARGEEFIAPRRDEIIAKMKNAADVATAAINGNEREALKRIKEEAGQKRSKIQQAIVEMEGMEPMRLVRKFWNENPDTAWLHFIGDRTKVGGIE